MAKGKAKAGENEDHIYDNPDVLAEQLTKTEQFIEKHRGKVLGVIGGVAVIIAGIFFFRYNVSEKNIEAQKELFQAVFYFEQDSLSKALNGDGNNYGFLEIIEEFGGTDAANIASYYSGVCYLQMGDFESAIEYLGDYSSSDILIQARAYSLMGDAYAELSEYGEAATYYEKAADYKPNEFFTPTYLKKAAVAFEKSKNLEKAQKCYEIIVDDYFNSPEYADARKHKVRLEVLLAG